MCGYRSWLLRGGGEAGCAFHLAAPSPMDGLRSRSSPVERAAAAGFPPDSPYGWRAPSAPVESLGGADVAAPQRIPRLPLQCSVCLRWVDQSRLAVVPIGALPWCAICHAVDQVRGAVKDAQPTLEKEDEILESLFGVFEALRGR